MARSFCSLACVQQFLAKFLRAVPKLALIFLFVHVAVMLYSVLSPKPNTVKSRADVLPGVVDGGNGLPLIRHLDVNLINKSHTLHIAKNKTINGMKNKFNKTEHEQFGKKLRKRKKKFDNL